MVKKDNQFNAEIFNAKLCAFLDASPVLSTPCLVWLLFLKKLDLAC